MASPSGRAVFQLRGLPRGTLVDLVACGPSAAGGTMSVYTDGAFLWCAAAARPAGRGPGRCMPGMAWVCACARSGRAARPWALTRLAGAVQSGGRLCCLSWRSAVRPGCAWCDVNERRGARRTIDRDGYNDRCAPLPARRAPCSVDRACQAARTSLHVVAGALQPRRVQEDDLPVPVSAVMLVCHALPSGDA